MTASRAADPAGVAAVFAVLSAAVAGAMPSMAMQAARVVRRVFVCTGLLLGFGRRVGFLLILVCLADVVDYNAGFTLSERKFT